MLRKLGPPHQLRELELASRRDLWRRSARRQDNRDQSTLQLHLVRPFLEALWNLAYHDTDKRRRRERARKVSIMKVAIWCQASQARLRAAYKRHTRYQRNPHDLPSRTLTRRVNAAKAHRLVRVIAPRSWDQRRRMWVADANVYVVTYRGKLWIKRNASSLRIALVV